MEFYGILALNMVTMVYLFFKTNCIAVICDNLYVRKI